MHTDRFEFATGNIAKLLAIPMYALGWVISWFVPRSRRRWAFGSGIGAGEGSLAVAVELLQRDPAVHATWLAADDAEAEDARRLGLRSVIRGGFAGFWTTLRARTLVVTHGAGDVNRFGTRGSRLVHLGHGVPLKRLHLDTPVTTAVRGPRIIRRLMTRMYRLGARQINLITASGPIAAARLRSAYRLEPGRVRSFGDPRLDALARVAADRERQHSAERELRDLLDIADEDPLILYAPTWRDGAIDPAIPDEEEAESIRTALEELGAHLVVRSHRLGIGSYAHLLGDRVHELSADRLLDITPRLAAFSTLITDYSSIAIDFSLLQRPIVWFAPDAEHFSANRGLYEPLEVTAAGRIDRNWQEVFGRLRAMTPGSTEDRIARTRARELSERFLQHRDGRASARLLDELERMNRPARELVPRGSVFFESYYGRQVSCHPLAIDADIADRFPDTPRYWSVTSETQAVPEGAIPLLVGGYEWFAVRRRATLLVVNDWLRYRFRRRLGQRVLQTWHGTMLKHLALGRPGVRLRTRIAIRRESRRWSLVISPNPHFTRVFRESYAYHGDLVEIGSPRSDRLARALAGDSRSPLEVAGSRRRLGIPVDARVLVYAPTWRREGEQAGALLDIPTLAGQLGESWTIVLRGHTRTGGFGPLPPGLTNVIDASGHPDINDVILAADLVVTDYSSLMFDTAIAKVPTAFFAPDLEAYRDRERGFTVDFEQRAPGPILSDPAEVVTVAQAIDAHGEHAPWMVSFAERRAAWRADFAPHEDGCAAARTVDELVRRRWLLPSGAEPCSPGS